MSIRLFSKWPKLFAILGAASLAGCGASSGPGEFDDLSPMSEGVAHAEGWSEIVMTANFAKTTVTTGAHFSTTRNACGKDAYGPIPIEIWNTLTQNLNAAIKDPALTDEYCVPTPPEQAKYMDGSAELVTPSGKRTLYTARDGQICGTVRDPAISNAILAQLHQVVTAADKEDCANGWGGY